MFKMVLTNFADIVLAHDDYFGDIVTWNKISNGLVSALTMSRRRDPVLLYTGTLNSP